MDGTTPAARRRVTVLLSLDRPDGTTRYVDQLVTRKPNHIHYVHFSWWTALFGRYDVLHVHWPEFLIRDRRILVRACTFVAFTLVMLRLSATGIPVVRTVHNETPHEPSSLMERMLLDALNSRVVTHIRLNHRTRIPGRANVVTIPHGDYVERFARDADSATRATRVRGRVLLIGLLRRYKGIDTLVDAVSASAAAQLRIVGKPTDPAFARELLALASPQISTLFGFVDDDVLVAEVRAAELVVLPYREIHNSGILLVALSLGTPVLASYSDTVDDLRVEVGAEWIRTYDGTLSAHDIDEGLAHARCPRADRPTFVGRDWQSVADAHARVYESL